jgi:integrase
MATNESLVFDREGEPYCPNTFGLAVREAREAIRATAGSASRSDAFLRGLMLENGVDLKTVSTAMGHSTIGITADTYAHVTQSMQQSAAERHLRDWLDGTATFMD